MGEPEKTILLQSDMSMPKTKMSHEAELPEVEWGEVEKENLKKQGSEQSQAMTMNAADGSDELRSAILEQPSILPMHGILNSLVTPLFLHRCSNRPNRIVAHMAQQNLSMSGGFEFGSCSIFFWLGPKLPKFSWFFCRACNSK